MLQSDIERIKAKQLTLRRLKREKSQDEFDSYLNSLDQETTCKYMHETSEIINLCMNKMNCKFKGEIYKSFTNTPHKECKRERILKFEKMLH